MGLTSRWQWGKVYCSPTTAQLVRLQLRVGEEFIETIPIGQPVDLQGVRVTFWDANHCPGAVLIEFKTPNLLMLHTGTFISLVSSEINYKDVIGKLI
jgi:DNA cross-link repair 1A protein